MVFFITFCGFGRCSVRALGTRKTWKTSSQERVRRAKATAAFQCLGDTLWNDLGKVFGKPKCVQDVVKTAQNGTKTCKTAQNGVKTIQDGPKRLFKEDQKGDRRVDYGDAKTADGRAAVIAFFIGFIMFFALQEIPNWARV